jgi:hypothetical protein
MTRRLELTLRRRWPWTPKPTVVFEGRGQPAQWGTGSWQVTESTTIRVYIFNRLWRFGHAEAVVDGAERLEYRAPWLPFLPGRLRS